MTPITFDPRRGKKKLKLKKTKEGKKLRWKEARITETKKCWISLEKKKTTRKEDDEEEQGKEEEEEEKEEEEDGTKKKGWRRKLPGGEEEK